MMKKILLLILLLAPSIALGWSRGELACFEKTDANDFIAPRLELRYKVYKGARGCKAHSCFVRRARKSRKVLQVFVAPEAKQEVNYNNYGWARQNVAVLSSLESLGDAFLVAQGVESSYIGRASQWKIDAALDDHWRFVAETECVRKTPWCKRQGGACIASFNEVQTLIPR